MTPRRLVPVLLALVVLAGCSYGVETAPPQARPMGPENTVAPPIPETWLGQVCSALFPAVRATEPAPATVPGDLAGSQARMVAYLDDRAAALDASADGVNRAGPAPVDNGQSTTTTIVDLLRERAAALREQRAQLAAVPANSDDTLANGLERARSVLVLPGPTVLRDLALPANLTAEAASVPACQALGAF